MAIFIYFLRMMSLTVLITFTQGLPYGEALEHHGFRIEADGSCTQCLSCHDGVLGKIAHYCIKECNSRYLHPIMKIYPPVGKEREYAPMATLRERGVKFENNRISCISCHNLRNHDRHHLAIENQGSRLCLACHIRK